MRPLVCLKIGGPLCHKTTCNKLEDQRFADLFQINKCTYVYICMYRCIFCKCENVSILDLISNKHELATVVNA